MSAYISFGNKLRSRPQTKCGENCSPLIIASVGTSQVADDLSSEVRKANRAIQIGAHAVTDHSFYGDIPAYHSALVASVDAAISTVTNYEFAARARDQRLSMKSMDGRYAIDVLNDQCRRGLDLITVHASFLRKHLESVRHSQRLIPTTSKGGGIISQFMRSSGRENPYYEYFDDVLAIAREYNVCISFGTSFRPATICDGWDDLLIDELTTMGALVAKANSQNVATMIEGIGHATIGDIPTHVRIAKQLCHNAPYRVLPMATDIALGYDHISAAIAAATAVLAGANAVTCISRAEHIGLPSENDVEEAVIASMIAAHCGEIGRGGSTARDRQMSETRWKQGCKGDWTCAIYTEGARKALERYSRLDDQLIQCSMCGSYCGIAAGISSATSIDRQS